MMSLYFFLFVNNSYGEFILVKRFLLFIDVIQLLIGMILQIEFDVCYGIIVIKQGEENFQICIKERRVFCNIQDFNATIFNQSCRNII